MKRKVSKTAVFQAHEGRDSYVHRLIDVRLLLCKFSLAFFLNSVGDKPLQWKEN